MASLLVYVLQQAIPIVSWSTIAVLPVIALGFGGLLAANPVLRRLCYRLKRRHLQRHGITIEATVAHQEWISIANARGPSGDRFDLTLRWQHPETDQVYEYVCMYIFPFGLSRKERQQFFNDYRSGAHLPVLFSPKHPGYFVVDIPFVPIWFDVLF